VILEAFILNHFSSMYRKKPECFSSSLSDS